MADRRVSVFLRADVSNFVRGMATASAATSAFGRQADGSGKEIDKFSGRLRVMADAALVLGPALVPLGAATIPVLTGALASLGAAAGGIGATVLAFNGLGDAMKAIDKAELEPTTENLQAMRVELEKLGPAGADFARYLQSISPAMESLQMAAREGMFPGMQEGLDDLLTRLPEVRDIISELSQGIGEMSASAGRDLAGDDWTAFFEYLRTDARPTLEAFSRSIGNVANGLADMFVAFAPLSRDFSSGMEDMTESFANWAAGLQDSETFQDFLDYVQKSGPQALDLLGSLATTFIAIVEAAAPIGAVVLPVLTAFVKVIGAIADTPLGAAFLTAAVAITAYNRAAQLATFTTGKLSAAMMKVNGRQAAAGIGLIALSMTDLDEKAGLSNTAMLGMAGMMAGPWGAAIGAGVGLTMDLAAANNDLEAAVRGADDAIRSMDLAAIRARRQEIEELLNPEANKDAFGLGSEFETGFDDLWNRISGASAEGEHALDDLADAEAKVSAGMSTSSNVFGQYIGNLQLTASAANAEREALLGAIDAMREKRQEALRGLNAELNYKGALLDARDALKENGKTVNENTRAGQANLQALYAMPAAWNDQSNAAKNAKGAMQAAKQAFIETATQMGMAEGKAKRLADRLYEIPPKRTTQINVDTGQAMGALHNLDALLDSMRYRTIHVTTEHSDIFGSRRPSAAGGYIRGPGTTTSDSIPALLSDREYVMRASSVDKYGVAMMHAINAGRYAGGGQVGGGGVDWSSVGGVVSDLVAFRRALKESEKALAAETAQRDDLRAKAGEVSSGIASGLQADMWAAPSNVWAAGAQRYDPIGKLNASTARAKRLIQAIKTLQAQGLTGGALAGILSEGLEAAEYMASQPLDMLNTYTAAYAENQGYIQQAANLGGQATFGDAADKLEPGIRELNKTVKDLQKQLDRLSGEHKANADKNGDKAGGGKDFAAANARRRAKR